MRSKKVVSECFKLLSIGLFLNWREKLYLWHLRLIKQLGVTVISFKMAVTCLRTLKIIFCVSIFHVGLFVSAGIAQKLKKTNDSIEKIIYRPHFSTNLKCVISHLFRKARKWFLCSCHCQHNASLLLCGEVAQRHDKWKERMQQSSWFFH